MVDKSLDNIIKHNKKDYGIFFTPAYIIDFIISLIDEEYLNNKKNINILEPASGLAQFLMGMKKNKPNIFEKGCKYAIEINKEIIKYIKENNIIDSKNAIKIINSDYLLWQSDLLFDLIIGNPPYGIPSLSKHYPIKVDKETKEKYKKIFSTWYGKYNLYGAFIEKSIKLLKENGQLIFIIPGTFLFLDEFKKLRQFLSQNGETNIIYIGSEVFKPLANTSSVILKFIKSSINKNKIILSEFFTDNKIKIIKEIDTWYGEVITFETDFTKKIEYTSLCTLGDIYDIRISPRTPEIKNSKYVIKGNISNNNYLPILNGRNLQCNKIIYEPITNYYIKKENISTLRKFFNKPHIVISLGFRKGGYIAAAYDEKCYPWMGDVYHLIKKDSSNINYNLSNEMLIKYINSDIIKRYIKETYKDIIYHLNISILKRLPLPNNK